MDVQPAEPRISIAIMSHPKRAAEARALAGRLEGARVVVDPDPQGAPNPLKTAIHAWRAVEPGATHHLVVQDDVLLSEAFLSRLRAGATLFPDAALAFYANWSSRNGAAVRLAAAAGATWVEENGYEYFPTLAVALPARYVEEYTELASSFVWWTEDDETMREFIQTRDIPAYLSAPSLVQHGELDSIAGNHVHGVRQAPCFSVEPVQDLSYEVLAHAIDFIPCMYSGRGQVLVRTVHDGRQEYLRRPWTDTLKPYGLDAADLRGRYAKLIAGSVRLQKAEEDLGTVFLFGAWVVAFLMGRVIGSDGVPRRPLSGRPPVLGGESMLRAGLHTIAAGGTNWTRMPMSLLAMYSSETDELVEAAYQTGFEG